MDNSKALEAAKRVAGPYMTALSNQQIDEVLREAVAAYEAALWVPVEEMKRDSTFYLIEVEATDDAHNPLEEEDVFVTVGCNGFDNDGINEWKLTGWNWSHDCLAECSGVIPRRFRPIPLPSAPEGGE